MIGELRIESDGAPSRRVEIEPRPLILGSAPNVDIPVDDPILSHRHCTVEIVGRQLVVTDLGSSDGTFARGQRIRQLAIETGEAFFIGKTRITFDEAESVPSNEPSATGRRATAETRAAPVARTESRRAVDSSTW